MTPDTIRIPVPGAAAVLMRFSPLPRRGDFQPDTWPVQVLKMAGGVAGEWWQVDLSAVGIPDGVYEYDFRIDRVGQAPLVAPDPYAEEITRFGGYRGVLRMRNGHRYRLPFDWQGELPAGGRLPDNNELVVYELPMRWVDSSSDAVERQVGLGTFDKAIFERLAYLQRLGINAIELLPVQDSTDTLNWGYGTRFFFAPDVDMGEPVDVKLFNSWDFVREFRNRAWQVQTTTFPGRPFIVIAEDSWRRPQITKDLGGGKVVDAMWDFDFRDELRRLVANRIWTRLGEPSRSTRVRALITGRPRFDDMAARVAYNTSHDVEGQEEQRLLQYFLEAANAGATVAPDLPALTQALGAVGTALEQVHATFALMLTAVGMPMFLAGEEFADLHDLPRHDWRLKMSDPVDWQRADLPGHRELLTRVTELVGLRRRLPALQRNEVEFFGMAGGVHPAFDEDQGPRVFAYCRTGGGPAGSPGQVAVVANCGRDDYPSFLLDWPWGGRPITESGGVGQPLPLLTGTRVDLALHPFQVRVFAL
jgi:hypothetical protein